MLQVPRDMLPSFHLFYFSLSFPLQAPSLAQPALLLPSPLRSCPAPRPPALFPCLLDPPRAPTPFRSPSLVTISAVQPPSLLLGSSAEPTSLLPGNLAYFALAQTLFFMAILTVSISQ
jgi:hypothetical protein